MQEKPPYSNSCFFLLFVIIVEIKYLLSCARGGDSNHNSMKVSEVNPP